jgi:hypothetical protein
MTLRNFLGPVLPLGIAVVVAGCGTPAPSTPVTPAPAPPNPNQPVQANPQPVDHLGDVSLTISAHHGNDPYKLTVINNGSSLRTIGIDNTVCNSVTGAGCTTLIPLNLVGAAPPGSTSQAPGLLNFPLPAGATVTLTMRSEATSADAPENVAVNSSGSTDSKQYPLTL